MVPSSMHDRPVDCMEELVKYVLMMRPHFPLFGGRYNKEETQRLEES